MQRTKPPFRADQVGSFLRPERLKEARARREKGEITAAQLRTVEDEEIKKLIKQQEDIGMQLATDGEFRRTFWHFDFLGGLTGIDLYDHTQGIQFQGAQTKAWDIRTVGKIDFPDDHPFLDHFRFLKANTKVVPKMTIPSPTVAHFRAGRIKISKDVYPDLDQYYEDLGKAYAKAVKAFYDAGCRYLQLDEVFIAMLCDPKYRDQMVKRGDDPEKLGPLYGHLINAAMSDIPSDMTITMHLCRGNYRSTWQGQGGYEKVQEILFNRINVHGYFMEYDSERAGGFEPLKLLPKNKKVVLGLVTTKSGQLESKDQIKRRIEEASRFAPLDQLCLSGQCGFASTEEGNTLAEEEQWAKLRMIVEVAKEVWG